MPGIDRSAAGDHDRTVHARQADYPHEWEIVRYERAGKWFIEYKHGSLIPCRHIGVGEAARLAVEAGAFVYFNRPGGAVFDRKVRALGGI